MEKPNVFSFDVENHFFRLGSVGDFDLVLIKIKKIINVVNTRYGSF